MRGGTLMSGGTLKAAIYEKRRIVKGRETIIFMLKSTIQIVLLYPYLVLLKVHSIT